MTATMDGKEVSKHSKYHVIIAQLSRESTNILTSIKDVYETFNIIMRRKPKENNFKAVLETIRDLMNTECVVPDWLHDIILGYGDPAAAHYSK